MPTLGVDCQFILDGTGYMVAPSGYTMHRPRLRRSSVTKGGGERYVDAGPGKREWHVNVMALNQLGDYAGQALAGQGWNVRESLRLSYEKSPGAGGDVLTLVDLDGGVYNVHFDDYIEHVVDPRTQITGLSFHCNVVLVEA